MASPISGVTNTPFILRDCLALGAVIDYRRGGRMDWKCVYVEHCKRHFLLYRPCYANIKNAMYNYLFFSVLEEWHLVNEASTWFSLSLLLWDPLLFSVEL